MTPDTPARLPTFQQLMIQGTTSDAGKSTLVCAFGRVYQRQGTSVAPFKPQNMALNSAVTADGGEIGRAQALQAQACGIDATTDMNPVLLKPNSDRGCQVIIQGKAIGNQDAQAYHDYKTVAMEAVLASYQRLQSRYHSLLIEGAGSPAEINLRDKDIANMGFAEAVDCPVILVADIDRGGVFAHLLGTLMCLSESEQNRVIGFIINRFRGDPALLQSGLDWLENKTGKPVFAVLPYLHGLYLDAEDALNQQQEASTPSEQRLNVVAPVYPRISNHTDFDALRVHPQVNLTLIGPEQTPPPADLVILPGSKHTRADLDWLIQQPADWPTYLRKHLRYGGKLLGICGGLQMLGEHIHDPAGIEGKAGSSTGLGYLTIQTTLEAEKTLRQVSGNLSLPDQPSVPIRGYEIHAGVSLTKEAVTTVISTDNNQSGGYLSDDQHILGTYWHGLLDTTEALSALLRWAGLKGKNHCQDFNHIREQQLDRLADTLDEHMNWEKLQAALHDLER